MIFRVIQTTGVVHLFDLQGDIVGQGLFDKSKRSGLVGISSIPITGYQRRAIPHSMKEFNWFVGETEWLPKNNPV